jgi:hypothetical protein
MRLAKQKVYRFIVGSTNTAISWFSLFLIWKMASKGSPKERRRIGRPPAGARAGERVKDYPQLSVRVPGDVKARLQAISPRLGAAAVAHHHRRESTATSAIAPTPNASRCTRSPTGRASAPDRVSAENRAFIFGT